MTKVEDFGGDTVDASDSSLAPLKRPAPSDYSDLLQVDPAHYTIANELARGGMGRIVRAHDRRLGRPVAIKELLPGHDDVRFEREARITARLAHPSIVAIHEAGRWPSGEAFFAMKLVAGESLDKKLAACKTDAERRALIPSVIAVTEALAYAHSERVIHRDLKPANVLVGDYGETVVIDWGLAKDLTSEIDDVAVGPYRANAQGETVVGAVMGTPAYMPPEQAEGERVDERADVYSLGALLYQVIAGVPPYTATTAKSVLEDVLRAPPRPLASVADNVPIELLAIVEKAMQRDPAKRFPTAKEMAEELRRFATGQLVASHEYTFGELARRWLAKYRAPLAVGAIAVVTLAVVGIVSVGKIVSETHRADREAADARARADRGTLERARALLDTDPTAAILALNELSAGAPEWRAARTVIADAESRGVARILVGDGAPIDELRFSPDGGKLAALSGSELIVWDLGTGVAARLFAPSNNPVQSIAWVGDDLEHVNDDNVVSRWHVFRGGDEVIAKFDRLARSLSPDGRWLVVQGVDRNTLIDLQTKGQRELGDLHAIAWDRDGHTLVGYARDHRSLQRIDGLTAPLVEQRLGSSDVSALASDGGNVTAIEYPDRVISAATGKVLPSGHAGEISLIEPFADGTVAVARRTDSGYGEVADTKELVADLTITIVDGSQNPAKLVGHRSSIQALAVSPGGQLASADFTGHVRLWTRAPIERIGTKHLAFAARLTPDRSSVIKFRVGNNAERIELATKKVAVMQPHYADGSESYPYDDGEVDMGPVHIREVAAATHAARWVTRDHDNRVFVWDANHGTQMCDSHIECNTAETVAVSGDGRYVAAFMDSLTLLLDVAKNDIIDLHLHAKLLTFSDDGLLLAIAGSNYQIALYDPVKKTTRTIATHPVIPTAMAFSPDNAQLAIADEFAIDLLDLRTNTATQLLGHEGGITSLTYTNDGRLVSTSGDNTTRVWNLADHTAQVLRSQAKPVLADVIGDVALTTGADGPRLWDVGAEISRVLPQHDSPTELAAFAADGSAITVDHDGRISRYRDATPVGEAALRVWIAALTTP